MTIAIQSIHYTLCHVIMLYSLVFYKRKPFKGVFYAITLIFIANALFAISFTYYDELGLFTGAAVPLIMILIFWLILDHSVTKSVITFAISTLMGIILEILSALAFLALSTAIKTTFNWNEVLIIAYSFSLVVIILSLPLIERMGRLIDPCSDAELTTWLPLASFVIYVQYFLRLIKPLTTHSFYLPDLLLTVAVTLVFIAFVTWQLKRVTDLMEQESKAAAVQFGKSIASSYLSHQHDIKNMLSALQRISHVEVTSIENDAAPILQAVLHQKRQEASLHGIEMSAHLIEPSLKFEKIAESQPMASPQNEVNAAIILGILLDNSLEHLLSYPELSREIHLELNLETYQMNVANPIAANSLIYLEKAFHKGYTSKMNAFQSGFGLYNARLLAEGLERNIQYRIEGSRVIFHV